MPTLAGQHTQTPPGDPQWRASDGSYINTFATIKSPFTARPATGVSTGTYRDLWRNSGSWAGSRGIGGWKVRLLRDPTATWYVATADDSSETTIPAAPTHQHPPPGLK